MKHITFQNNPRIVDRQLKEIEQERSKGKIDSEIKRDLMNSNIDLSQKEYLRCIKLFSMLDKQYLRLNENWLKILYVKDIFLNVTMQAT